MRVLLPFIRFLIFCSYVLFVDGFFSFYQIMDVLWGWFGLWVWVMIPMWYACVLGFSMVECCLLCFFHFFCLHAIDLVVEVDFAYVI